MAPTFTSEETGGEVAHIQHRGKLLQVFLAPWHIERRPGRVTEEPHLHVQDLDGRPGRIVPLDHPLAKELTAFHPEVADLVAPLDAPTAPSPPPASPPPPPASED